MDKIRIKDLRFRCIIGINPEERHEKQDVDINLVLFTDLSVSCRSDRIEDTLDYKTLKQRIRTFVRASSFNLIERLAQGIADICLEDERVAKVRVRLDKPGALRFARTVGVEIERERGDE